MPATKRWQGDAKDQADVWTFTPGGTIAVGSTFTFTVAGKTMVYTSTGTTAAAVNIGVTAQWNSTSDPLSPEFREYEAVDNTTTVVFTAKKKGIPGTIGVAAGGSGSPTASCTNTTPATGKNFITNAANLSDGVALANGDTLVFDAGSVDCLFGDISSLTGLTIRVLEGYKGLIGLPETNGSGSAAYPEYRTKYITIAGGTLEVDNSEARRVRVAFGSTQASLIVRNSGPRNDDGMPAVTVTGGATGSRADITRGSVGIAYYSGETANFPTVNQSFVDRQDADANVIIGEGCSTITALKKSGGNLRNYAPVTTLTHLPGAGVTVQMAGAVGTAQIDGGTLVWNSSGMLTTPLLSGDAFMDFDQDTRAKTVTNRFDLYGKQCRIRDTRQVVASMICDYNGGATAAQVDRGTNYSATYGAVA